MAVLFRITTAIVLALNVLSATASLDNSHHDAAHHHHVVRSHSHEVMERAETTALEPRSEESPEAEAAEVETREVLPRGWGKAGLAWNDGPKKYMQPLLKTGKITWCYTWSAWPCCSGSNCPEWIPQLWGNKQLSTWEKNVMQKKNHKWGHVLGFNEPDQGGQSAMSINEAVKLWWKYLEPVNSNVNVGPAVTASPNGIKWIANFMKACKGCKIDVVPFHFYGMNADAFISTCNAFHKAYPNKRIWITEWACQNYGGAKGQCSQSDVNNFLRKTQAFLDETSWIERYAWFGALTEFPGGFNTKNRLIGKDGSITALGKQYIGA